MVDRADVPPEDSALRTPHSTIPPTGRLLGLDFGTKRVGVAVSDVEQRFVTFWRDVELAGRPVLLVSGSRYAVTD